MSLELKINGILIIECYVVRIKPTKIGTPEIGTMCLYQFYVEDKPVSKIKCPYGSAEVLGQEMLEHYMEYKKGK